MLVGILLVSAVLAVFSHHGWAEFDQTKEITLTGIARDIAFEYPHTSMKLETAEAEWDILMAPPRRINRMGVNDENLYNGIPVTVVGHPHREQEKMMRIFKITIGDETLNIR